MRLLTVHVYELQMHTVRINTHGCQPISRFCLVKYVATLQDDDVCNHARVIVKGWCPEHTKPLFPPESIDC